MSNVAQNKAEDDIGSPPSITAGNITGSQGAPTLRQQNPLGDFSSSTYNIGLYMITPEAFTTYGETSVWDLKSMVLIVQSGGINDKGDAPRSKAFNGLDLHIDNLEITSVINPKETGVASTSYMFRFQIFEPFGIGFTSNLVRAAQELQTKSNVEQPIKEPLNALMTHYMLAIRFYGYDEKGAIIQGPAKSGSTNEEASFERFFPVFITEMKSKLDNKTATYDVTAVMTNQQIVYGKKRGFVPDATTISADTVGNALDKLADSLNKKQKMLVDKGEQEIADEYEFIFTANSNIKGERIADKDHFVVGNMPMPEVLNSMNINVRLSASGKAEQIKQQNRNIQIAAQTPMLGVIDQIITQSTYLTKVLQVVDKEIIETVDPKDKAFVSNPNPKPLEWYHVTPRVAVKKYDNKRKEFAYKMIYIIQPKLVPYIRSSSVTNTSSYEGAYKVYDYWYTGRNSEVLSYEQTFNLLYFVESAATSEAPSANKSDPAPTFSRPSTASSPTGRISGTNDVVNSVRTSLYSPGDNIHANIKILGDPDFLMTSEAGTVKEYEQGRQWYGNDYTINPGASQVFIEVGFEQVTDYNLNDGLMIPDNNIMFWDYPEDVRKKSNNRMIYMVVSLKSRFSKGVFTQELKTILPPFIRDNTKKEDPRADTKEAAAAAPAAAATAPATAPAATTPDTTTKSYPVKANTNFKSVIASAEDDSPGTVVFRTPIPVMARELPNTNNSIIRKSTN